MCDPTFIWVSLARCRASFLPLLLTASGVVMERRYTGVMCGVAYGLVVPLAVHLVDVTTHKRFNTGRFVAYGLLLLFGSFCVTLQVTTVQSHEPHLTGKFVAGEL